MNNGTLSIYLSIYLQASFNELVEYIYIYIYIYIFPGKE